MTKQRMSQTVTSVKGFSLRITNEAKKAKEKWNVHANKRRKQQQQKRQVTSHYEANKKNAFN